MKEFDICVFGGCSMDMTFYQNEDLTYQTNQTYQSQEGKVQTKLSLQHVRGQRLLC